MPYYIIRKKALNKCNIIGARRKLNVTSVHKGGE
jgi:hypothetical protein